MKKLRIVFMGTPDFAVGILDGLITGGHQVVTAITVADKPAGRGQKINQSAVKKYCVENNVPTLQPTSLKDEQFLNELRELQADLFVVVAFRMLPELVWAMPPLGTINLHASLLPQYRGAAPINWALINGESETGVTTFFIEKEIDTGLVIARESIAITENQNAGELHDALLEIGKRLVNRSVELIQDGSVTRVAQNSLIEGELKAAPKIFKEDCRINWSKGVQEIHNFCRGLNPFPVAWTVTVNPETMEEKTLRLYTCEKTDVPVEADRPIICTKNQIMIGCGDYYLNVLELQVEGKRKMTVKEFLAGNTLDNYRLI